MSDMKPGIHFPEDRSLWQPRHLLFERNDRLFVRHLGSTGSIVLGVRGRMLDAAGQIRPFEQTFSVSSDRSSGLTVIDVGEGWLLSAAVYVSSGSPSHGRAYAVLGILRGLDASTNIVQLLSADYVNDAHGPCFPGGPVRHSVDGRGFVELVTGSDPAAGSEISETVPTNARWHITSVTAQLVTDGTTADRRPRLKITDGSTTALLIPTQQVITAGATEELSWLDVGTILTSDNVQCMPLPINLMLREGWTIETDTINLQAGDDWGPPRITIEEWIDE